MAYDLILLSQQNSSLSRSQIGGVVQEIKEIPAIASFSEISSGSTHPNPIDLISLSEHLEEDEAASQSFSEFCGSNGLEENENSEASAAQYLDSIWGVNLVSIKLPVNEAHARQVYAALLQFATRRNLRIFDPQMGNDIDLLNPGELPPLW